MNRHPARPRASLGFTLVEFMIAITVSLIILAALTSTFVANSRARTEIERANDQIESGRFALSTLSSDLELAGFMSHLNVKTADTSLPVPGAKPSPCLSDVPSLNANMLIHVQGYDGDAASIAPAIPTTCISDIKAGTDVIVVRRVATCVGGTANCPMVTNAPYFQASLCGNGSELGASGGVVASNYYRLDTVIGNLNRTQRDCATRALLRQYMTNVYFVANNDQAGDGIPTLKRAELGGDADGDGTADVNAGGRLFAITPVAHGIQDLQFEYGIDTNGDGAPDVFTASPDTYNPGGAPFANCGANTTYCVKNWRNVMAVKIYVLARNTNPSPSQVDSKIYTLGLKADGSAKCALDANNDGICEAFLNNYKRHVYATSVRLNNPAGRLE